ncbi:hypothetical protein RFH42_16280 [Acinetobacter rudis]|uniref:hypothetical protein n=1 Tax=Acinetobacter rudis TaxID=632955 RepID=UPI00280DC002|nr:hypothetical protein [Acinetobacter rudis]MDQ8954508.1 hypothetical protein [Acinetobacter rudis]
MSTPVDLNTALFAQLERLSNPELHGEELAAEIQRSDAIEKISEQVIKNNNMRLNAAKLVAEYRGVKNAESVEIPQNLIG